jgi:hypothetical protein
MAFLTFMYYIRQRGVGFDFTSPLIEYSCLPVNGIYTPYLFLIFCFLDSSSSASECTPSARSLSVYLGRSQKVRKTAGKYEAG